MIALLLMASIVNVSTIATYLRGDTWNDCRQIGLIFATRPNSGQDVEDTPRQKYLTSQRATSFSNDFVWGTSQGCVRHLDVAHWISTWTDCLTNGRTLIVSFKQPQSWKTTLHASMVHEVKIASEAKPLAADSCGGSSQNNSPHTGVFEHTSDGRIVIPIFGHTLTLTCDRAGFEIFSQQHGDILASWPSHTARFNNNVHSDEEFKAALASAEFVRVFFALPSVREASYPRHKNDVFQGRFPISRLPERFSITFLSSQRLSLDNCEGNYRSLCKELNATVSASSQDKVDEYGYVSIPRPAGAGKDTRFVNIRPEYYSALHLPLYFDCLTGERSFCEDGSYGPGFPSFQLQPGVDMNVLFDGSEVPRSDWAIIHVYAEDVLKSMLDSTTESHQ